MVPFKFSSIPTCFIPSCSKLYFSVWFWLSVHIKNAKYKYSDWKSCTWIWRLLMNKLQHGELVGPLKMTRFLQGFGFPVKELFNLHPRCTGLMYAYGKEYRTWRDLLNQYLDFHNADFHSISVFLEENLIVYSTVEIVNLQLSAVVGEENW